MRVLIVRIGAMGDVLHAMPAVAALRERHPDWFIGWVIEPRWLPLLQAEGEGSASLLRGLGMPLVDRTYLSASQEWKRRPFSRDTLEDIFSLRRELRSGQFDLCVDMQGLIRSAVIGKMAGTKRFVGRAKPREMPARWLYELRVKTDAVHVIEQGCELLGAAVDEVLQPAKVSLPIDDAAESRCDALLARALPGGGSFVLLAPAAGWGSKVWPSERFGGVAAELGRAGYRVLVNAVSDEDARAAEVVQTSGGYAVAVPCDVSEMIAVIRRSALVIAGDSGPLHLAAALNKPVVGLYGPTDPARTGPYGTASRVLRHAASQTDHSRRGGAEAGLMQITVDEVAGAALELLRGEQDKVVV